MIETVKLRDKPELKIHLNKTSIKIIATSYPKNCGTFLLNDIIGVELTPKSTDWFITALSWIVALLTTSGGGENYKNEANLKLRTKNQTLKIWLRNADFKKAERISKLIKVKKIT
ncbi:hypothetical protein [uncultured Algibacter sp.]|uniref:hypothetical protein n=1 Tax=uncultured Algibacter sp. TaxID=298659 RepID=UPI00260E6321|nr:hypothetical protein [uncultured Algibacter sp.]